MNIYDRLLFSRYLEEDEHIQHVIHRHWFVIMSDTIKITFFAILPPILGILFFTGVNFHSLFFYPLLIWLIYGFSQFFYVWMDWYFDAWILTNQSIIDIEWISLWRRSSNKIEYEDVSGVSYEFTGFWGYILRFGDMAMDKNSSQTVELGDVDNPKKAETKILDIRRKHMSAKNEGDSEAIKELLAEVIATHIENKKANPEPEEEPIKTPKVEEGKKITDIKVKPKA